MEVGDQRGQFVACLSSYFAFGAFEKVGVFYTVLIHFLLFDRSRARKGDVTFFSLLPSTFPPKPTFFNRKSRLHLILKPVIHPIYAVGASKRRLQKLIEVFLVCDYVRFDSFGERRCRKIDSRVETTFAVGSFPLDHLRLRCPCSCPAKLRKCRHRSIGVCRLSTCSTIVKR